ncbi:rhodanese-like domain-containing protein [Campylobacter sp. 19-13652]|uniref:rhodanese-like domain-containing protein n=1 Tax=Campylobacter sp. 19-13652 TaxID=2840180 RepID=UPI001C766C4D|nr:rhodanese-like domain-containing protein [Campylobacter sp. 19-13652]BCX79808.1 sulfurtransferase [Campylobacter sp. 19-13652]
MIKILAALIVFLGFANAEIKTVDVTPDSVSQYPQIIDVRTPDEWRETGIVEGALTIDIVGNKQKFAQEVLSKIDPTKPVALICRTGRRSTYAANFLEEELAKQGIKLEIINLNGGVVSLIKQGYHTVPYDK